MKQPTSSLEWIRSEPILSSVRLSLITSETRIWFFLSAGWTVNAADGWFINDLQRHFVPYFFIKYATRFLPVNRMARHDGPVSVTRAFAADDWRHLLTEAGIPAERACIERFLPFRYGVSCTKEIET